MDSIIFDSIMYWKINFWLQRTHEAQEKRLTSVLVVQNKVKHAKENFHNETQLSSDHDSANVSSWRAKYSNKLSSGAHSVISTHRCLSSTDKAWTTSQSSSLSVLQLWCTFSHSLFSLVWKAPKIEEFLIELIWQRITTQWLSLFWWFPEF